MVVSTAPSPPPRAAPPAHDIPYDPAHDRAHDAAPAAPLLDVQGLDVRLGGVVVLADAAITLHPGEVVGVLGPNGAGKSTLLRAITRQVQPERGAITLAGQPLAAYSARAFARRVAVVQQLPEAPPELPVRELVLLGRHPHLGLLDRESGRDRAVAADALAEVGLTALADRPLGTLSGGQRRRVFIARALAQEPQVLLLDEPTANLDVQAQGELGDLLRRLARRGVGVLTVLHDLSFAALLCDRVVLLAAGRVRGTGTAAEVLTEAAVRAAYGAAVEVIRHPRTGAPVILPRGGERPAADRQAAAAPGEGRP